MRVFVVAFLSILFLLSCTASIPKLEHENAKHSILVFGDSWAYLIEHHQVFQELLKDKGMAKRHNVLSLSKSGSTTDYWTGLRGQFILNLFFRNEGLDTIEYVIISLGGNDLMNNLHVAQTHEEKMEVYGEIAKNYQELYAFFKINLPKAKIIILGLDYPNFKESLHQSLIPSKSKDYWEGMGEPSSHQVNTAIGDMYRVILAKNPDILYSNNLGMMQASINPDLKMPLPSEVNFGGDVYADTPAEYMEGSTEYAGLEYVDPIHLKKEGYKILVNRLFDNFIELQ